MVPLLAVLRASPLPQPLWRGEVPKPAASSADPLFLAQRAARYWRWPRGGLEVAWRWPGGLVWKSIFLPFKARTNNMAITKHLFRSVA